MRLRYSTPALRDLANILSYVGAQALAYAELCADHVESTVARILEYPHLAQLTNLRDVRRALVRDFRLSIFYTIHSDELVILHIRHTSQQPLHTKK